MPETFIPEKNNTTSTEANIYESQEASPKSSTISLNETSICSCNDINEQVQVRMFLLETYKDNFSSL